MKDLKDLAVACIATEHKKEKAALASQAKGILEGVNLPSKPSQAWLKRTFGLSYYASVNSSAKIVKGEKEGVDTLILYLAAAENAGVDVCSYANVCKLLCLVSSGRALMEKGRNPSKQRISIARIIKTWIQVFRPDLGNAWLQLEIDSKAKAAKKAGRKFAVRLNGTSDLDFQDIIRANPDKAFYDYTKRPLDKIQRFENYHLTISFASLQAWRVANYRKALAEGLNISVAVDAASFDAALSLPYAYDADRDDLRHLDPEKGKLALLKVKRVASSFQDKKGQFVLGLEGVKHLAEVLGIN